MRMFETAPQRVTMVAALVAALVLAACGSSESGSGASTDGGAATKGKPVGLVFDLGGRGDHSFNDGAAAGVDRAKRELGVKVKELVPNGGGANREELLRLLSQQRYPLVFAVGFLFADSVGKTAKDFPNTRYALIASSVDAPNVTGLTFSEEQGSYLVGAAAALKSKTGHIGFVGGVEDPTTKVFQAGYDAGARAIKPDIKIDARYVTQPPDFSGFKDPAKGREIALGMYQSGADIIYHAAGGTGEGVFQAARRSSTGASKHWAIGVDSDQYDTLPANLKEYCLTSMVKRLDVAVFDTIKRFQAGQPVPNHQYTLADDGMEVATSGGFIDDIKPRLDELKKKIVSGAVTVPTKP
jgi:basic membrane protein A